MKKHLVFYGTSLLDHSHMSLEVNGWVYWKKRLQVWKWRKHHTMFRPVLMLRKANQKSTTLLKGK